MEQRLATIPKSLEPGDAIMRLTTSAGQVFGHENLGVIEQVGAGVVCVKLGDRVVLSFNIRRLLADIFRPPRSISAWAIGWNKSSRCANRCAKASQNLRKGSGDKMPGVMCSI